MAERTKRKSLRVPDSLRVAATDLKDKEFGGDWESLWLVGIKLYCFIANAKKKPEHPITFEYVNNEGTNDKSRSFEWVISLRASFDELKVESEISKFDEEQDKVAERDGTEAYRFGDSSIVDLYSSEIYKLLGELGLGHGAVSAADIRRSALLMLCQWKKLSKQKFVLSVNSKPFNADSPFPWEIEEQEVDEPEFEPGHLVHVGAIRATTRELGPTKLKSDLEFIHSVEDEFAPLEEAVAAGGGRR